MDGTAGSQQMSSGNREWCAPLDEGYWQALLQQGEIALEVAPPADPQEAFRVLDIESQRPLELEPVSEHQQDAASQADEWQIAQHALDRGELFDLPVVGANRGGLLVAWNGLHGFVPASHLKEMPRCTDPGERVAELNGHIGESLSLRLIEVDPRQRRLVFSERAAMSDLTPAAILSKLSPGDICRGTVTNLTAFGAFVDLGGVEGLIHISELSWDRVRNPSVILDPGQEIKVYVVGVNPEEGRIALSLKRLRVNPWTEIASRCKLGQLLDGQITNVVSFGAFVRIEEGIEGLIHVSELAEGSFAHPRNIVREGDVVRVRVLNVDPDNQRLALSLRQAAEAEWQGPG